ncbi:MAG: hypothetical protein ACOYVE_08910 [Melioribacter sp.]|uniref:hypothetical protein n=1 Tax=Melioribacter sp. TaxID=2052167 RepID=UPI003BE9EEAB
MKQKLIYVLFIVSLIQLKAQGLSEQEKQEIINSLSIVTDDSIGTDHYAPYAIERIIEDEIKEAEQAIIENIWKQDPYTQTRFLDALRLLGSDKAEELTLAFIDSVDHYPEDEYFTKLELKTLVLYILFQKSNFSHYQIVYDRLEEDWEEACGETVDLLYYIAKGMPSERERAKRELMKIAEKAGDYAFRIYALSFLDEIYGEEMIPFFIERFKNDESSDVRFVIAKFRFSNYKNTEIKNALREQIYKEQEGIVRRRIADELITRYNSPEVSKFLKDYLPLELDSNYQFLINDLLISKPPKPDSSETPQSMIDSLISYNNQCYELGWLSYEWVWNINKTQLENARLMLNTGYPSSTAIILQAYENWVNTAKGYGWINEDAYRFLYYYSVYLRERL